MLGFRVHVPTSYCNHNIHDIVGMSYLVNFMMSRARTRICNTVDRDRHILAIPYYRDCVQINLDRTLDHETFLSRQINREDSFIQLYRWIFTV